MAVNFADYIVVGRDPFYDYNDGNMQPENAGPMLGGMTPAPAAQQMQTPQPTMPQVPQFQQQAQPSISVAPPSATAQIPSATPPVDRIQQAIQQQRQMTPEQRSQNFNTGVRAGLQRGGAMLRRNLGYSDQPRQPDPLITNTPGIGFQRVGPQPSFIDRMRQEDGPGRGNSFWDQVARQMSQPQRSSATGVETTRVRPASPSTGAGLRITNTPGDGFQDVSERAMRQRDRVATERYQAQHPYQPAPPNSGLHPVARIPEEPRIWAPVQRRNAPPRVEGTTQSLGFQPQDAGRYDRARQANDRAFYQENYGPEAGAVQEENRQARNRRR